MMQRNDLGYPSARRLTADQVRRVMRAGGICIRDLAREAHITLAVVRRWRAEGIGNPNDVMSFREYVLRLWAAKHNERIEQ